VLSRRELGRATLARQLLLERAPLGVLDAVERLAGLQAQEPRPPFIGLWSRLAGFDPDELRGALRSGAIVRGPLFRGTLHIVSRADWSLFRAAIEPMLAAAAARFRDRGGGADLDAVIARGAAALAERPHTAAQLRALLAAAHPGADERALAYWVRMHVPVTMVATDELWCFPRDPALTLAAPAGPGGERVELVRRYLAAFGPASVADAQEWSGLRGLAATFEAIGGELERFRDERGRQLFDLPDAPRPGAGVPAPPRFLPDFDNLVLAHADRTRLIADEHRSRLVTKNLRVNATVLIDGEARATWSLRRRGARATLLIAPFAALPAGVGAALVAEGEALARLAEPAARSVEVAVEDA
jgi:hypothetical protein